MVSNRRFEDRVAVVTGASGAIGMAIAEVLADEGARLMLVDLLPVSDATKARLIERGAPAVEWMACDIGRQESAKTVVMRAIAALGGFDILVNVAGTMIYTPLSELTAPDWTKLLEVNLVGPALLTGQALARMSRGGAIVNVASVHARQTTSLVAPYAAAKAGLDSLTRSASIEGADRSIRANAVLPGAIDTPMLWASPTIASGMEAVDPADVGTPADVAAAVAFLASDAARFVNGASLLVDGGRLARL